MPRPMVEIMAAAFVEAELRNVTDLKGNPFTWEKEGILRQRHVIRCMREVLKAMAEAELTRTMIRAYWHDDVSSDPAEIWRALLDAAAHEFAADLSDDGEPERIRQEIDDILKEE